MTIYQEEYKKYRSTPLAKSRNAARHRARYWMEKKYGKAALKGKEVHHIKDWNGSNLDNSLKNLKIVSREENLKSLPKHRTNIRNY